MSTPKVGIVVPAYNAERYIEECLYSAINQNYPCVHVYVVDDASTDHTSEIVAKVASSYPDRITWYSRSVNKGEGFTRQEVIEIAMSDGCSYIAPLDADDLRTHDSITNQVALLEKNSNAGACYGKFDIIHSNGKPFTGMCWEKLLVWAKGLPEGDIWDSLIAYGTVGIGSAIVIRAEVANICRYDPKFRYFTDLDYWAQITTSPRYSRIIAFDGVVYTYRFHAHQAMNRIDPHELLSLRYTTMQIIGLRVFHRLEQQGRAVPCSKRRRLWRLLTLRTMINAIRQGDWTRLIDLKRDFVKPITRLEAIYRDLKSEGRIHELLGAWAS
jgi:glycosyltransferase involved in cell wall biosynthesis